MDTEQIKEIMAELVLRSISQSADQVLESYIKSINPNSRTRRLLTDEFYDAMRYQGLYKNKLPFTKEEIKEDLSQRAITEDDLINIFGIDPYIAKVVAMSLLDIDDYRFFLERAPLTIRVNSHKITRDLLFEKLIKKYNIEKTSLSPFGIKFSEQINVRQLEEFKKGYFEIQDEASQLVALLVNPKPGEKILDLCAGKGGKSIAIQSQSFNTLLLDAYDISQERLSVLKKRAKILELKINFPKAIKQNYYDKVLIDAPCSGSGVIRREVDNLSKLTPERLDSLIHTQQELIENGLAYLKHGGLLIYATCSFLCPENERQIELIKTKYGNTIQIIPFDQLLDRSMARYLPDSDFLKTSPKIFKMDSFFAVALKKLY